MTDRSRTAVYDDSPAQPRPYVVMTDAGEIGFASLEQAMAYAKVRRACRCNNRRIEAVAFAAIVIAVAIGVWRYL